MFKKKLDFIIDVETVDVYAPQWNMSNWSRSIFNIGITAIERVSRTEVLSIQIGIDKIWSLPYKYIKDFYRKNFNRADFMLMFSTFKEFTNYFNEIVEDLNKEYNIQFWSYNAAFDYGAFKENALREGVQITKLIENYSCIMRLATHFLSLPENNVKFCNWSVENAYSEYITNSSKDRVLEFISAIGNVRTTAQNVYRFITDDISFIELHKGLQDTQCERDILKWCQGFKGWTKADASLGVGWIRTNFDFIMGKNGTSKGHLIAGTNLTITNLAKANELINYLNLQTSN